MSVEIFKESTIFFSPQKFSTITVSGKDASPFLQNLLSNDIGLLTQEKTIRSIFPSTSGKIAFDVFLQKPKEHAIQIFIDANQCLALQKHLDFFHILEDIEIKQTEQKTFFYLLFCKEQEKKMYKPFYPTEIIEIGEKYFLLENSPAKNSDVLQKLQELSSEEFENIRAFFKITKNLVDFGKKRLPQEVGFRKIVSFKKGCFVGQEAIARLEHKGRLVRVLSQFVCQKPLQKEQKLASKNTLVGSVTSSCPYPYQGNYYALGYLKTQNLLNKDAIYLDKENTLVEVYPLEKI